MKTFMVVLFLVLALCLSIQINDARAEAKTDLLEDACTKPQAPDAEQQKLCLESAYRWRVVIMRYEKLRRCQISSTCSQAKKGELAEGLTYAKDKAVEYQESVISRLKESDEGNAMWFTAATTDQMREVRIRMNEAKKWKR